MSAANTEGMPTRYLLFIEEYEGADYQGEATSLDNVPGDVNLIYAVPPDAPVITLRLKEIARWDIDGQGRTIRCAWVDTSGREAHGSPHYDRTEYRYGEPVPDGYCKRFNGYETVIMSHAEAAEIERAVQNAVMGADGKRLVTYPNGATGRVYDASGMMPLW